MFTVEVLREALVAAPNRFEWADFSTFFMNDGTRVDQTAIHWESQIYQALYFCNIRLVCNDKSLGGRN
jgi:hypothetical protein